MRVLVVGAGSVGLGLASCLLHGGHEVWLTSRPATVRALQAHGLTRSGLFGTVHVPPERFTASAELPPPGAPAFAYVLVCVQSFDSPTVAADLAAHPHLLSPDTRLVLFQNGYGNHEVFAAALPGAELLAARVITGFRRLADHHVEVTVHAAPIHVGSLLAERSTAAAPLCDAVTAGGIPAQVTPHIGRDLWAKLLYNAMLNPLGALLGVTYGDLGASEHTRALMAQVLAEGFAVMHASGHATHWESATAFGAAFYAEMLPPTRLHESSMLQSLRSGRRTEIDALNGAIARLGRQHGVPTPTNDAVVRLVRYLEERASAGPDQSCQPVATS